MLYTEFNMEDALEVRFEEGVEKGIEKGIIQLEETTEVIRQLLEQG